MISFFKDVINLGVNEGQLLFEQRKIRLVNIFALISAGLMLAFSMLNIVLGANSQALLILSGCLFIAFPTIYLNKVGRYQLARFIFLGLGLIFVDIVTFRAVFNFQNRHNEVFLVGYSTLIVVLMNNPLKSILFSFNVVSTLVMITLRQTIAGLPITSDTIMAYLNALVAFGCVYFFISIFKQELIRSVGKVEEFGEELQKQEKEILKQRDELFANRQLLRSTIDSLPVFISMIDMKGKYLIANSQYAKAFKMPISEIEGKHYSEILPESILKTHRLLINDGFKGIGREFDEIAEIDKQNVIHSLGKYIPVYDSRKEQIALAVYVVDVTKLKKTEAELVSLNETKNRLLSVISHDIRAPLNSLKGIINISGNITQENLSQFINKVNNRLTIVTFNLDNLLNWARGQMDGLNLSPEEININDLIIRNIEMMKDVSKKKKVEIIYSESSPLNVNADPESLNLVLRNILNNAIKFTPEGEKIHIRSFTENENMCIEVVDSGDGISEEIIEQLHSGVTALNSEEGTMGEKGTGLGLTLSMDLIIRNNGALKFKNSDKGTTVTIKIPLA
ncbi:sensor histidine kinase [Fulvivirga lutimaris]|uniref:sensor histidine kinase n=1 Tax=Fulvivirga lutimaris TaxID=1819566 RepID=UPI0012BBF5B7|nr:PAS domain-containing sensor histidine kinase [Fulvivirga lutimaris]MTI41445.1 PAS domain-containing sensor histidine kinase [Fulvivirga lutimaris]